MIWLMGCNFGFDVMFRQKEKRGKWSAFEREVRFFARPFPLDSRKAHSSSFPTTHDEDQLDEEADKAHDDEAERGLGGDLGELCFVYFERRRRRKRLSGEKEKNTSAR